MNVSLWRLLAQRRFDETVRRALAVDRTDPEYAAARLVAVRAEVARGRMAAAADVLERTADHLFTTELRLWQVFLPVLMWTDTADAVAKARRELAAASSDDSLTPRCRAEALALRARLTVVLVEYEELPAADRQLAADQYAAAADAYRSLAMSHETWQLTETRCRVLWEIAGHPVEPILALLADAAGGVDPIAVAMAKLMMTRIRLETILGAAEQIDADALVAECTAIEADLNGAGHAFGSSLVEWEINRVLLRHCFALPADAADEWTSDFIAAGATHLAHQVWRELNTFHALHGEGELQRAAAGRAGGGSQTGTQWWVVRLVEHVRQCEELLRSGNVARAGAVAREFLTQSPPRSARISLRVQLASQLASVGQIAAARAQLTAALDDLAPVRPTALTGEVLAYLAMLELDDLPTALAHVTEAVDAARKLGDLDDVGRYLRIRCQLRVEHRRRTGQRPAFTEEADDDLVQALAAVTPLTTLASCQTAVGVHQARSQAMLFDGRLVDALDSLAAAEHVARAVSLGNDLGFILTNAGMVYTQLARERRSIELYDRAAEVLTEGRERLLQAEITQSAWSPQFMTANALWEAARLEADLERFHRRIDRALVMLEEAATEVDVMRVFVGGSTTLEQHVAGIGFVVDKQQLYELGFRIAAYGKADAALALRWLERMKSRALLDGLASATLPQADLENNVLLRRERDLQTQRATAGGFAELADLHRRRNTVLDEMLNDPVTAGYAAFRRSDPPSWDAVRDILIAERKTWGRRIVIAQYCVDSNMAHLFGMAADWPVPRMVTIPCDTRRLAAVARTTFRESGGVRMMMREHDDGGYAIWQEFAPLVTPIAGWTDSEDDIVYLIPHGMLHDLPLHTLDVTADLPLGLRNPVCYAPSLGVLLHTLGRQRHFEGHTAVFGDARDNLPWAVDEAKAVAAVLGAPEPAIGKNVTRAAVMNALHTMRIVHIAAHAYASATDGLDSGVHLAGDDVLRARDLLVAPMNADLVVLSGCETGVSTHNPGDEAVGLVRALLQGGVRTTLTSQWRVRDDSARTLLTAFHSSNASMSRADALRAAMRAGRDRHFYHWGGFVLVGDWR